MNVSLGVSITWLGHATVLYRSLQGRSLLVDAWVDGNPACPPESKRLPPIDLLAITHGHFDHFDDAVTIAKAHRPEVVCNFEISLYLGAKGVEKVHGINKGGSITLQGIKLTMTQAVHSSSIKEGDQVLPGGEPCGYVLEFENGTRVYHAGDTCLFGDMKLIGELYRPSIAVLPIGDLFTMAPLEAARAAEMIGARHVVPIHHSTFPALTGTPAELRKRLEASKEIQVLELKPGETVGATP
jgi:L-ascorbate metabolism protein UlaG (beta-lactamase superfamily)